MKRILVLGAGLTSAPLIRYYAGRRELRLVIASNDLTRARQVLADSGAAAELVDLDVADTASLSRLVDDAGLVVSLLPAALHAGAAAICVEKRVPLITTSYVSPAMRELDGRAREAGVLLLNEVGLDPGIDHMSTARMVRDIRGRGGSIHSFMSCCGGIPALDSNTNPWGYKFSWSPRGVLLAGRQPARYLAGGRTVEIPGSELFAHHWPYEIEGHGRFEIYPNRDSIPYIDAYGLTGVRGMFRGTIRYRGWCDTMLAAVRLGLFEVEEIAWPPHATFADIIERRVPGGRASLIARAAEFAGVGVDSEVMARLEWAGLFSQRPIGVTKASPLDVFSARLLKLMQYAPGDRDMVAMQHHFVSSSPDGKSETVVSTLVETGQEHGDSAMARTVTLPAAIAARLILEGQVELTGVQIPTAPELYDPILDELEEMGITFTESATPVFDGPFA